MREGSVHYRITVSGTIDPNWSDRLGGLKIVARKSEDNTSRTILTGEIVDQSALMGILETLHDLHRPILNICTNQCDCTEEE